MPIGFKSSLFTLIETQTELAVKLWVYDGVGKENLYFNDQSKHQVVLFLVIVVEFSK